MTIEGAYREQDRSHRASRLLKNYSDPADDSLSFQIRFSFVPAILQNKMGTLEFFRSLLGVMGAPMAGHLLDGNYELTTAVHRSPAPDWLIDKGLKVCSNPMEIAAWSDVVITMVPNTPEVE